MPRHFLARIALLIGVVAVGLAVIPAIAYDEPISWSREKREKAPAPGGALSVKVKGVEFTFGKPATAPAATAPTPPPPPNPVKPYRIAAVILGLTGLLTGPFAWNARRQRPVVVTAMVLCCAAVVWQYFTMGVIAGVAGVILVLIFSAFG